MFEPVVAAAVEAVRSARPEAALFVYGSVASGQARPGRSDVDLVGVGLPAEEAAAIGAELSGRFAEVCREVAIGATRPADFAGDSDEVYGNRVFLRHYCVQLAGPPRTDLDRRFPADARAARGLDGDIGVRAERWRRELAGGAAPGVVGRRVARKALLAAASLVGVHDRTWTTDRARGARRWAELAPAAEDLALMLAWADSAAVPTADEVERVLDGTVAGLVAAFSEVIGLWVIPAQPTSLT